MSAESSSNEGASAARIEHRRLRAPGRHGETLQEPALSKTAAEFASQTGEQDRFDGIKVDGQSLSSLQAVGRQELLKRAADYTAQYRTVELADRDQRSIIMSGHQPEVFHPGVWFKNFALSSLAQATNATPVNLVVDNDVCNSVSVRVPALIGGQASVSLVPFDDPFAAVPYEMRHVVNDRVFESFPTRATESLGQTYRDFGTNGDEPLLAESLWKHAGVARDALGKDASLGLVLAAGRHRLESDAGLQTLELPISQLAKTLAFNRFAAHVLVHQDSFNQIYNQRLLEYRQVHGIRSSAHPVPELETDGGWIESPFWIWSNDRPQRRRLFSRLIGSSIHLTDRDGWQHQLSLRTLADGLQELGETCICIRPRALITTMFSRLVLSDRFLHGIGGAKYDQLTDLIAADFFSVALPPYSTLTATMHLPFNQSPVTRHDQTALMRRLRELRFHPEQFGDPSDASSQKWIDQKRAAIQGDGQLPGLQRQRLIEEANLSLFANLIDQAEALRRQLTEFPPRIRSSRVLNSREYSFALFPESLVGELKRMAEVSKES